MELSLPGKAYLLALNPKSGRLRDRERSAYAVRAAALTDLVLRGRLGDDGGTPVVRPAGSTGDDVLDEVLGQLVEDRPGSWKGAVRKGSRGTVRTVEAQLEAAGVVEPRRAHVLGVFPVRGERLRDTGAQHRLRSVVDGVLRGGGEVAAIPPSDAALTALAVTARVKGIATAGERRRYSDRLDALGASAGAPAPALRSVLRALDGVRAGIASSANGGSGG
ncbi:GOLPH3/VPS74 family protein [Amycolatopsis minnesotensis]|uniref:GPP34 family phosphoprotein n=1 Tax=Amycolatopsis minnesotensis TaxID=337894 RepID=A0ABN2Q3T9_9PSEU